MGSQSAQSTLSIDRRAMLGGGCALADSIGKHPPKYFEALKTAAIASKRADIFQLIEDRLEIRQKILFALFLQNFFGPAPFFIR
jgi:hypothetical protein